MTSSQNLKYLTYTVFIINKFCSYQVEDTRHHSQEELSCDDSIFSEHNLRPTVTASIPCKLQPTVTAPILLPTVTASTASGLLPTVTSSSDRKLMLTVTSSTAPTEAIVSIVQYTKVQLIAIEPRSKRCQIEWDANREKITNIVCEITFLSCHRCSLIVVPLRHTLVFSSCYQIWTVR